MKNLKKVFGFLVVVVLVLFLTGCAGVRIRRWQEGCGTMTVRVVVGMNIKDVDAVTVRVLCDSVAKGCEGDEIAIARKNVSDRENIFVDLGAIPAGEFEVRVDLSYTGQFVGHGFTLTEVLERNETPVVVVVEK